MRIIVAPDSFKECLPAHEVAAHIAAGVRRAAPDAEVVEVPMADGGQGTVEALVRATQGTFRWADVTGPMGETVRARYGVVGGSAQQTAILEMAAASGLELVAPDRRDPSLATTYGTGELLCSAIDAGARRVLLGIGGSATNDGGAGLGQALGYRLLDVHGVEIPRGGGALDLLHRIDAGEASQRLAGVVVDVACDVVNPLTGPQGASEVFGPQKGASPAMIRRLDANLAHFAKIVRRDLGVEIEKVPGAGAAGGLGGGLLAFAGANLVRGVEMVIDAVGLREKLRGADLCLTGEGAIDVSSRFGKTAVGVASAGRELGVPVVALAGAVREGASAILEQGVTAYFDVARRPLTLAAAVAETPAALAETAEQVVRLFLAGRAR